VTQLVEDLRRLFRESIRFGQVAREGLDDRQARERPGDVRQIVQLAKACVGLFREVSCAVEIVAAPREGCGAKPRARLKRRRHIGGTERPLEPAPSFAESTCRRPEVREAGYQLDCDLRFVGCLEPAESSAKVVQFALENGPFDHRAAPRPLHDLVCERDEVLRVPAAKRVGFLAVGKPLLRVRADRLQHREPRLAVRSLLLPKEVVVDERREQREKSVAAANGLHGLERAAAYEDGELYEERLLVRPEQAVAPVDRRAKRLLSRRQIARAAGEELEALLQPGEQRPRGEELRPGGGELDREREPVETDADLGNRRRVRVRDREVGLHGLPPLDEERDRIVL